MEVALCHIFDKPRKEAVEEDGLGAMLEEELGIATIRYSRSLRFLGYYM